MNIKTSPHLLSDGYIDQKVLNRFVNSHPILRMLDALAGTGRNNFHEKGVWEICLCALILRLEPACEIRHILEALPDHQQAMDELDLLNTLAHLGYYGCQSTSELEYIDERLLPGLFIPDQGVPSIVLARDNDGCLQFYDPVSKLISTVPPTIDRQGQVWFFQKYDENQSATSKFMRGGSGSSWFYSLLGRFKGTFVQIMLTGFILNLIALTLPIFIMLVYDRVISSGFVEALPMLVFGAVMAIIFEWKLRAVRSEGLSWLAGRLDSIVSNKIFSHLLGLSPKLIEEASVAAQIARIKTFESVRDFFSGSVFLSLLDAPFVVLSLVTLFFIAGELVLVPILMMCCYILLFVIIRRKVKTSIRIAAKTSSARQKFTIETIEKLDGIRMHGLVRKWQNKFRDLSGREMMTHFHLGWLGIVSETCAHTLTVLSAILTVSLGVHLIWVEVINSGALVGGMILVWRVLTPFYSLCTMVPRLEQLRNSILQVNTLIDIETEAEEGKSFARLAKLKGAISFHNVSFRYHNQGDYLFYNLSFEVQSGQLISVTGDNGTGKIIIFKLLKSLICPTDGVIRIDGFDIRQLDAPFLRRQIAYVPRVQQFFPGTVIENIRYSNPLASENDVIEALQRACAWEEVCKLPHGLYTRIGSYGAEDMTVSLETRLSLARGYLHSAPILLIDELPNTLLSGETGKNLKQYLIESKGKRTTLICTYREDYLRLMDKVVWLRGLEAPVFDAPDKVLKKISG